MPHTVLKRARSHSLSRAAAVVGGLLSVAVLAVVALLAWHEYRLTLDADRNQGELQARVLADHASRSVGAASVLLAYLSGQLVYTESDYASPRTETLMTQALVALPFVREIDLLDADGRIVASSLPTNTGTVLDPSRLGRLPGTGQEALGGFTPGRSLQSLAAPATGKPMAGVGFIPIIRGIGAPNGKLLYLVALLNPDSFSSFQVLTVNDPHSAAYMTDYQGQVLASSGPNSLAPGASLAAHPVFSRYLPRVEHASYVGQGVAPAVQVVAFRLAKDRPVLVLVEQPYEDSVATWWEAVRWFVLAAGLVVLFLVGVTWMAHRSFRSREAAEQELDEARMDVARREQELRVLVKSVQELLFRTDSQGRISYVNDRWAALRGEGAQQAQGHALQDMVEPVDRAAVAALFSLDSGQGVRTTTAAMLSAQGQLHRFDIAVVPLRNGEGITGFAGSAVDVTGRIAAQHGLQRQLRFVALLQEISPQPVATMDREGHYLTMNRAWEEFMGRKREDVVGRRGEHFMSAADAALHAQRDAQLWRDGGSLRYEAAVRHRDGSVRDVVVTKVLVAGDEENPPSLLSTMMDVSEFREAERATREARDAAEESSRAKSEFIANISHELRTPLQSILGFSELGMARGQDQPRLLGMFNDIHAAGQRMLALVNDLLDVSKIESAVGAISLERADVRALVQAVLQEFRPQLAGRQLRLEIDLGPGALVAKVDPVRFGQVVRNVVANAVRFSPDGGVIEVRGRLLVSHRQVCISVRDHGVGIPIAETEKIFDAFVQSSITKDGSGGTGLGLAISRKIMDAHGGRIVADNMSDGGAIFSIFLPARVHLDRETTF